MKTFWLVGCYVVIIMLAFPCTAHAYINPGSGVILVQVITAMAAGGVLMFRNSIVDLFVKIFKRGKQKNKNGK